MILFCSILFGFTCAVNWNISNNKNKTRMHSSRMRTGRTLTVFRKLEEPPPPENLEQTPPPEIWSRHPPKIWSRHTTPPKIWSRHPPPRKFGADTPSPRDQTPPPVNRMTDRCKNITLAKTSFRLVKTFDKGLEINLTYDNIM